MTNKLIKIGGKTYYLDINALMKWCLSSTSNPFKETEINEGYDTNDEGEIQMMTKVIRELKTSNSNDDTIRYDFIKLLLTPFINGVVDIEELQSNFSYVLLFNTLIQMNFLIEITNK